jgi:hypothetical protein
VRVGCVESPLSAKHSMRFPDTDLPCEQPDEEAAQRPQCREGTDYARNDQKRVSRLSKKTIMNGSNDTRSRSRTGPDAIPYTKDALEQDLERLQGAWDDSQGDRRRDAIYAYLQAVYDLVSWWSAEGCDVDRARQALRSRALRPLPREDVFAAMIRCTADPARADKRTRSKWSRVLRYVKMQKDEKEPLAVFIKGKGGINECNVRYGRCLRRLAASRRSVAEFQRRSASKRKGVIRKIRS